MSPERPDCGGLFVRLSVDGDIPPTPRRLSGRALAKVANEALWHASKTRTAELSASTLFADFLERLRFSAGE